VKKIIGAIAIALALSACGGSEPEPPPVTVDPQIAIDAEDARVAAAVSAALAAVEAEAEAEAEAAAEAERVVADAERAEADAEAAFWADEYIYWESLLGEVDDFAKARDGYDTYPEVQPLCKEDIDRLWDINGAFIDARNELPGDSIYRDYVYRSYMWVWARAESWQACVDGDWDSAEFWNEEANKRVGASQEAREELARALARLKSAV
jgi:hypothetical protein